MKTKRTIVVLAIVAAAGSALAGITYKAETRSIDAGGRGRKVMAMDAMVDGSNAKMVFTESAGPGMAAGSYMLTTDAGKTIYLVDPAKQEYMRWDIEEMARMAGAAMEAAKGLVNMEFENPKVEKLSEKKGPELLGYPTTHTRFRTAYAMSVRVFGFGSRTSIETEEDLWTTTALKDPALNVWQQALNIKTGNEELDKMVASAKDRVRGFPLKQVTVTKTTDDKGKTETTRTEMTVTELKQVSVPASTFVIPKAYTEQRMELDEETRREADAAEADDEAPTELKSLLRMLPGRRR